MVLSIDQGGDIARPQVVSHTELLLKASSKTSRQTLSMIFEDAAREFEASLESMRNIGRIEPITSCAISIETARRLLDREAFHSYCSAMHDLLKTYADHSPRRPWFETLLGSRPQKNRESIIRQFDEYLAGVIDELGDEEPLKG